MAKLSWLRKNIIDDIKCKFFWYFLYKNGCFFMLLGIIKECTESVELIMIKIL